MINNYVNVVVLGNFNPNILTHQFLVTECGFDLGREPKKQIQQIPIAASVEYDKIFFFADLGRFEIKEEACVDPQKSKVPYYLETYLNTLPYTPIKKCGANFSYTAEIALKKLESVETQLAVNRKSLCKSLEVDNIELNMHFDVSPESERIKGWTLRTMPEGQRSTTRLSVSRKVDSNAITVDFNYEVNLEKDVSLIKVITKEYNKIHELFMAQFRGLFNEGIL